MLRPNLLVLSDVHLGCDLVQHARPDAPARGEASLERDRELVAFLDWYREHRDGGRPWRLVIAGDLIDFVGMCISPVPDEIETELTEEELLNGLGGSADHTRAKLRLVAEHHADVMAALARFIQHDNTIVVVRGNHDVDFHWQEVKDEFLAILERHGASVAQRVEFADWFYYEEGRVYVEHGHQYDDYCSHDYVLHPVSPSDPRRSHRSLSDILLRYVVRPTRGMTESGHDAASALDYLRFGARLGWRGMLALGGRFAAAVAACLALWREHFSDAARWVRDEHERKIALLAGAKQVSLIKLRALASLQRPPVTRSVLRLLAGVMLDRVAIALASLVIVTTVLVTRWTIELGIGVTIGTLVLALVAWGWRRARGTLDPRQALRDGAQRVASIFPAAFVVMGHTHLPEVVVQEDGAQGTHTYVNLGAWAEEDPPEGSGLPRLPASRTHLVVRDVDGKPVASLLKWDALEGPKQL